MQHAHIKAILEGVIPEVKAAIAAAQKPLLERIAILESRSPEKGDPGEPGKDGASVTIDDVAPLIETAVVKAVSALPAPKDGEPGAPGEKGEPGKDGASVTIEDVAPLIETAVVKAVSALPAPKDGEPGAPGEKGEPGKDGASVTIEDVAPLIETAVVKAVSALPAPKDGEPGAPGEKGEPGKDGASVTIDDVAPLIEAQVVKAVSALPAPKDGEPGAPGEKGEPGRDGRDASDIPMLKGFISDEVRVSTRDALKSISLRTPDEGRTLILAADVAGESVESEIKTALPLDCGVWREREYKKGDGASFGGSFFIAQEDTSDKPETSKAWRLAVKRGRDGKDGKPGERGLPGLKGDRGEPGPRGFGG